MKTRRVLTVFFIAFLLMGCGSGQLVKNHTQETVGVGRDAITQSKNYFDALLVLQQRRAAVIYATQPNCTFNINNIIKVRLREYNPPSLCATAQDIKNNNYFDVNLMPLDEAMFQPDMEILKVFSKYLDALTSYTSDPKTPVSGYINSAIGNAKAISGLNDDQKKSLASLVTYLEKLIAEEKQGRDIGNLIRKDGPGQVANMGMVKEHIHKLKVIYDDVMNQDVFNYLAVYFDSNKGKAQFVTYDNSYTYVDNLLNLRQLIKKSVNQPTAAEKTIAAFQQYHEGLTNIINGNLSEKDKEEKLAIQKQQLLDAISDIKDFVKPYLPLLIAAL
ncbi:MAG: hypothetical protein QM578_24020 [Pantoea sp.]|uniref:hypothetical protein n=1 Tax=Pantoea sp. TaxID=69393 RepID=UPI0039E70FFA